MPNLARRLFAVLAILFSVAATPVGADPAARIALGGYDPVAYFTDGRPEKGVPDYSASYDNATYLFKSADHRNQFTANPDKYAPQFNGYCAIDLSRGLKTEPDPEAWTIADGRLYVFGKKRGPSVFAEQKADILDKANQNLAILKD